MLFRLTENVFVQDDVGDTRHRVDWTLGDVPSAADPTSLAHVIQFYRAGGPAQQVQHLTAASVRRAHANAKSPVQLLATPLDGEADCVPQGFSATPPLRRTIADVHKFEVSRRLPLLFDILELAATLANPSGYLIYTNSDICLTANFYNAVRVFLTTGFDSVIINRRTVGTLDEYGASPELGAADVGTKHPGFDCFVFPTAWVAKFLKTESCIGVGWVMRPLLYQLVALANRLLIARSLHLTYHYGDDQVSRAPAFNEYTAHNQSQMRAALETLCRHPRQFDKLQAFCAAHGEMFRPTAIFPPPPFSELK
jgi:hypothetical protein